MKDVTEAYIAKEEASQRKPVELYHVFDENSVVDWYLTDGDVAVVYDGNTYLPATLSRSSAKHDAQLEVTTMSIQASCIASFVVDYISANPVEILWISIMKLFRDQDPLESSVVFIGQIKNVSFKGIAARVVCVGFEHFLKQTIPKWRYQLTCNHILFDDKCTKAAADYKTIAVVTLNSTKRELTSTSFAALADGYFTGGKVTFGNETRTIVNHITSVITVMYKFKELEDSDSVDAYPGCDGRIETCRDKYDNILNFLGFPFIPQDNPGIRIM